ncbi:UDP-N-acetylmuramate:L-alanyl-gamma-D-glutamyl-meso-diaminopimelate ligase [Psychrosphaera sp. B3R10]|uniref:UDP-N-acetylmuramate:L-alanyl-gamma-D-glutamyl- meso-diaminopimelate ligase n=1 Tax=unclassified Psychrosphaera TaxID=2641570 RepID=UPI001C083E5F|nr:MULTISPECIES: UDP-N-acetylmuramate:L-alanyl-gamma-D-glutamyl-meso-diaminopimelate ligase [unclassified Psychrosphaera]MBU2881958.1 UDP-N-acetylmuramate:L-alanyl-gamma-D-glutamyl-meso-diaminopimelate ligase [Psychrosphaera sp. I2R16]MBU2991269.1 UDP-N-acetylmuramate:L-alanyl-gamma-D-glutamyl-meso-diaminopimelate ligase [Psychrosphaera sp. B3R10]
MHIHILGICGTFMGGIAAIAKELGHKVTGSDQNVYPPMSTQLEQLGIELTQGWDTSQFDPQPDVVVIGNALSRGNPAVEYILDRNIPYTSGPEWLKHHLLKDRWVIASSGTHGKTTTSSMIAWLLEDAGLEPGYLIGGVPGNFSVSARAGKSPFFVIEADEYDTAFFDKRSKFVHYLPRTVTINNLEFDHADIFPDISAIQTQFHHLVRTVPSTGKIIAPKHVNAITETLQRGCWSDVELVGDHADWQAKLMPNSEGRTDGSRFDVYYQQTLVGQVAWTLTGQHNVDNGLMALAASHHAGLTTAQAIASLSNFISPKRRMELIYNQHNIEVYDDFAHHPTAINTTLAGLRQKVGTRRIIAIIEPRSNTMKMGVHKDTLADSWQNADQVFLFLEKDLDWAERLSNSTTPTTIETSISSLVARVIEICQPNDHIVVMSNGGFSGIHQLITNQLNTKFASN